MTPRGRYKVLDSPTSLPADMGFLPAGKMTFTPQNSLPPIVPANQCRALCVVGLFLKVQLFGFDMSTHPPNPVRIQRRRAKGWKMPPNTVYVGRPTKWGNPFAVGETVHKGPMYSGRDEIVRDTDHAARLYREWLFNQRSARELLLPLRGKNLACWCPLDQPCHADVLLEIANA
jgi:hypothetical protein